MSRELPVLRWMEQQGKDRDWEWLAGRLRTKYSPDYLRLVVTGHHRGSWDLCFELEALTGVSAHDIRCTAEAAS